MADITGQSIGRYQILSRLGEGGMATVYKARDTRLDRDVALKLIRVDQFAPAMMDHILVRFEREARSLARLSHNSIVRVYDYGEHDGAPFLVLEFCGGGDLKQRMTGQPMDWREAIGLVLPVARALRYSHQQGIIHRDVKPSNIMFNTSGEPMLSDFGIAKMLETDDAATLTGTGVGIGTPGYMAPEQWTGETSPQSDQYGLGVVLYELLTGRKPYEADTPAGILIKQTSEALPLPSKFAPTIPPEVEVALLKSLDRNPAMRHADMAEFIKAFEGLLQQTPVVESKPVVVAAPPPPADTYKTLDVVVTEEKPIPVTPADWATTADPLPKRKPINWKQLVIGGAALVVLAGVIWGGVQLSKGFPVAPESSATPTVTLNAIKTNVPRVTQNPTPQVSETGTPLSIFFIPPEIKASFISIVTPNPDAVFSPPQFAQSIDNNYQPVEPATAFKNPIKQMYAIFNYDKMTPGAQWTTLWYRDGELVNYETKPWDGGTGGYGYDNWQPSPEKWLPGSYQMVIFVGEEMEAIGTFSVEGEPTISATLPEEIIDAKGIKMRLVPAGEFIMGGDSKTALAECQKFSMNCSFKDFTSEEPIHTVTLDDYYMDVYEVTNSLYKVCVDAGGCTPPANNGYGTSSAQNLPVTDVDWSQAKAYCEWRGARLPTEAEWEKAARGTDGRIYPWGKGFDCSRANYRGCGVTAMAVGSYESGKSPYGMYDMTGNVWEWVNDWYGESYYQDSPLDNPQGPASGEYRVMRGGAWYFIDGYIRSTTRGVSRPTNAGDFMGFRCASSASTETTPVASTPQPSDAPTPLPLQGLAGTWKGSCYGEETFSIEWKNDGYVVSSCKIETSKSSTFPISYQSWENGILSWTCPQLVPYSGPPYYTDQTRSQYYSFKVQSITADTLNLSLVVTVDYPSPDTLFASACSFQRSAP